MDVYIYLILYYKHTLFPLWPTFILEYNRFFDYYDYSFVH